MICQLGEGLRGLQGFPGKAGPPGIKGDLGLKGEKGEHETLLLKNIKSIGKKIFVSTGKEDTFDSGKSLCAKAGSAVAFPRNEAENSFKDLIRPSKQAYMGMSDEQTEGKFLYLNGGAVTYTNSNAGEPNNLRNEDCAVIQDSGKWNDVNCSNSRASIICEFLS
ncbi:LOW QUALITY PROTEIN: mannose-binding protein-like [Pluvialis apricaria]